MLMGNFKSHPLRNCSKNNDWFLLLELRRLQSESKAIPLSPPSKPYVHDSHCSPSYVNGASTSQAWGPGKCLDCSQRLALPAVTRQSLEGERKFMGRGRSERLQGCNSRRRGRKYLMNVRLTYPWILQVMPQGIWHGSSKHSFIPQ